MRGSLGVCDYATRVVLRSATVCGARQSSRPGAHQMAWRASWCSSVRFAPRFASPRKTHTTTTPTTRCMATGGNNMDDTRRRQNARAARAVPLKLVMVSKGGGSGMDSVCKEWGDKVGRYTSFSEIVVKSNPKNAKAPLDQLSHEAERVMKHLDASDYVVLMDERGEALSSEQLSKLIADAGNTHNAISFVIGGPFGHGEPVIARADRKLKLSAFVMNHQVARLVLLEQMYRAWTILKGEPYHH